MKTKGFTLVELLVVIAILAILATVSVVGYTSFIDRANMSNAQTEADQIKSIVSTASMADDYVKLTDSIYYDKANDKFVASVTLTDGETVFDATSEIGELVAAGGTLTIVNTDDLQYNNYDYNVDVMTRAAEKAE